MRLVYTCVGRKVLSGCVTLSYYPCCYADCNWTATPMVSEDTLRTFISLNPRPISMVSPRQSLKYAYSHVVVL